MGDTQLSNQPLLLALIGVGCISDHNECIPGYWTLDFIQTGREVLDVMWKLELHFLTVINRN